MTPAHLVINRGKCCICNVDVQTDSVFCTTHWFSLPSDLRKKWWKETGYSKRDPSILLWREVQEALCVRDPLTIDQITDTNVRRCTSDTGFNHPLDAWSVAEWANAVAGEVGEAMDEVITLACYLTMFTGRASNTAKKLLRHRDQLRGNVKIEDQDAVVIHARLGKELADIVHYVTLTAAAANIDLTKCIRDVFNKKSEEIGSDIRL